ncbi:MAG: methylated-DNA--[protein]-cysteine S-methyltransferase [Anaerolineales bacterium]
MTENELFYELLPSSFGSLALLWGEGAEGLRVHRIFLSNQQVRAKDEVRARHPGACLGTHPALRSLGERLQAFLGGERVHFDLQRMALERCSDFQRRVILTEYSIPRGRVSTYGRIAGALGVTGGARAVGSALARNPFPLVIPCHRAVRSDGSVGGYQGGASMKRALLELEGVEVSPAGRVLVDHFYEPTPPTREVW